MRALILAVALAGTAYPAMAQSSPVDQTKIYVTKPAACEALEKKGVDAYLDDEVLALSFKEGIRGLEFSCNFFDVKSNPNDDGVLVEAICDQPGFRFPDLIAISPWDDTRIQVGSSHDLTGALVAAMSGEAVADNDGNDGQAFGISLYSRCDNLSELPRE